MAISRLFRFAISWLESAAVSFFNRFTAYFEVPMSDVGAVQDIRAVRDLLDGYVRPKLAAVTQRLDPVSGRAMRSRVLNLLGEIGILLCDLEAILTISPAVVELGTGILQDRADEDA